MVIWFFRHWLWLYNLFNALLLVMAFASPISYALGWGGAGSMMFGFLSIFCTQVPTHSYTNSLWCWRKTDGRDKSAPHRH